MDKSDKNMYISAIGSDPPGLSGRRATETEGKIFHKNYFFTFLVANCLRYCTGVILKCVEKTLEK